MLVEPRNLELRGFQALDALALGARLVVEVPIEAELAVKAGLLPLERRRASARATTA